ncbi:MAG: cellulase family glycosylhydrolase [Ardenticatenaceae bacterium]|nr:cellulase family glycosylhydrolase [Ardenticatenaceae bacterium]
MKVQIPRWRGFNLLEMGGWSHTTGDFREDDFRWMADWGFDFARLPANYTLWTAAHDVYQVDEAKIENIDWAIQLGEKYDIHINLNFHHGPGYCVNREIDPAFNLWQSPAALDAFIYHWELFARRYKEIASAQLSFNLINEPGVVNSQMSRQDYERVVRSTVAAIRAIDSKRLIFVDGLTYGNEPCPEFHDLEVVQSTRAYQPINLTHYKAAWIKGSDGWEAPDWPGRMSDGEVWNRQRLEKHYAPWIELAKEGVGVHCGEGGTFNHTSHTVALTWLEDVLEILTEAGIGFALWNLRGDFGILNSGRLDVDYEDWYGHKLDRRLLDLLRRF